MRSATSTLRSIGTMWPAPSSSSNLAPGISAAISADPSGGTTRSAEPANASTGSLMVGKASVRSIPSSRRAKPRRRRTGLSKPMARAAATWLRRASTPKFFLANTMP